MIEKTNQVKMFRASAIVGTYTLTANVKVSMNDSLLSIDSGNVAESSSNSLATFYLYEGGALNLSVVNKSELDAISTAVTNFINQLIVVK
ncbi:MAG: hypothetical protein RR388_05830 [Rikenellaceae bacterium]